MHIYKIAICKSKAKSPGYLTISLVRLSYKPREVFIGRLHSMGFSFATTPLRCNRWKLLKDDFKCYISLPNTDPK